MNLLKALLITLVLYFSGFYLGWNLKEAKYRNNAYIFCEHNAPSGLFSQCVLELNAILDMVGN